MTKVKIYIWTYCSFCTRAKSFLEEKNIPYNEIIIDGDDDKKQSLYNKTGQSTVPFVFINDKFIGGYTELMLLDKEGKLQNLIKG